MEIGTVLALLLDKWSSITITSTIKETTDRKQLLKEVVMCESVFFSGTC